MKLFFYWACFLASLTSCGYHYQPSKIGALHPIEVSVPFILGDSDSALNNALVYQLSSSGCFRLTQQGGAYQLQTKILSDDQSRIGFRYDSDNVSGKREKNLLGVEDRRTVSVEVKLVDLRTGKNLIDPFIISASAEYDYTDPGSPRDLVVNPSSGSAESVIQFSLGQLDSYEGAYDSSSRLVFRRIAEKVTLSLIHQLSKKEQG